MVALGANLTKDANGDRIDQRVVGAGNADGAIHLVAQLLGEGAAVEIESAQAVGVERRELLEEVLVVGQAGRAIGACIERRLDVFDTRAYDQRLVGPGQVESFARTQELAGQDRASLVRRPCPVRRIWAEPRFESRFLTGLDGEDHGHRGPAFARAHV